MRASLLKASLGSLCLIATAAATGCQPGANAPEDLVVVSIASTPPPPLSGGTLIVTADETRAVAADSDRDLVWIVNLRDEKLEHTVVLEKNDEPGRLVEDGAGLVHLALRGAGALVTIDPASGKIVRRDKVCNAPRGL